jgi:hypothetical protein
MRIFIILIFASVLIQCSSSSDPDAKEEKIKWLTHDAWVAENVSSDEGDLTFQYTDFVIIFMRNPNDTFDGDYYSTGGGHAFSELIGRWKFNDDLSKLLLDGGKEIRIIASKEKLTMNFFVAPSGGRVSGLSGNFTFVLKRRA